MARTLDQIIAEATGGFDNPVASKFTELLREAYQAGRESLPQQWEDAKDAAAARRLRPSDAKVMTVWQSPSGNLHLRRSCSGAGPARNMRLVQVAREPWSHEKHCRCLQRTLMPETEKASR